MNLIDVKKQKVWS